MALKRHMLYTNLVLATLERFSNLIIGFLMANMTYMTSFRSSFWLLEPLETRWLKIKTIPTCRPAAAGKNSLTEMLAIR